jgi:hypothetical protein
MKCINEGRKLPWYERLLAPACVYQARWMCRLGVPPIPLWTIWWFISFKDWCRRGGRRKAPLAVSHDDQIPF